MKGTKSFRQMKIRIPCEVATSLKAAAEDAHSSMNDEVFRRLQRTLVEDGYLKYEARKYS